MMVETDPVVGAGCAQAHGPRNAPEMINDRQVHRRCDLVVRPMRMGFVTSVTCIRRFFPALDNTEAARNAPYSPDAVSSKVALAELAIATRPTANNAVQPPQVRLGALPWQSSTYRSLRPGQRVFFFGRRRHIHGHPLLPSLKPSRREKGRRTRWESPATSTGKWVPIWRQLAVSARWIAQSKTVLSDYRN